MLLALVTAQEIIGLDSTYESYQSAFWKSKTPGRRVLEDHLLSEWILTPERPLARWVIDEPPASRLVAATRPPRLTRPRQPGQQRVFIEGLPLKGKLGFSVKATAANYLAIDQIDVFRLGYACGLREGDIIHRVDNRRARTHKALIEAILAGMAEGGATLEVVRDNQPETIIMREIELPSLEDDEFWEYMDESYFDEDTVIDSSVTSDSTADE